MYRRVRVTHFFAALATLLLASTPSGAQQQRPLKVFISVDMEGLSGVVTGPDVSRTANGDYAHFRSVMAMETNAAIEGAFRAGATEVLVRDSHGSKQNLLPLDVDSRARLLRGATTGPRNMMEGVDSTFAAAVFIGYHARAGTPNAILAHTSNGNVVDFSINGVSLPEGRPLASLVKLFECILANGFKHHKARLRLRIPLATEQVFVEQ